MSEIRLLKDREILTALVEDLRDAPSVVCTCLQLNRFVITLFSDHLAAGGSLTVLANHPGRFKAVAEMQFAVRQSLITQGANVQWFRSARLLHQKVILIAPDIAYLGSHNLTKGAFFSNHEISIRTEDKDIYDKLIDRVLQFCGMT